MKKLEMEKLEWKISYKTTSKVSLNATFTFFKFSKGDTDGVHKMSGVLDLKVKSCVYLKNKERKE